MRPSIRRSWFLSSLLAFLSPSVVLSQAPSSRPSPLALPTSRPSPLALPPKKPPASRPALTAEQKLCHDILPPPPPPAPPASKPTAGASATSFTPVPPAPPQRPIYYDAPQSVAVSSDGTRLAAGYTGGIGYSTKKDPKTGEDVRVSQQDGRLLVWDIQTQTLLFEAPSHGDVVKIAFSSGGRYLAAWMAYTPGDSVNGDHLRIFDLLTRAQYTFRDSRGISFNWWSPQGFAFVGSKHLLLRVFGSFFLLDLETKTHTLVRLPLPPTLHVYGSYDVLDISVSRDGDRLAFLTRYNQTKLVFCQGPKGWLLRSSAPDPKVRVQPTSIPATTFSKAGVTCVASPSIPGLDGYHLALSSDGQGLLATSRTGKVFLFSPATMKESRTWQAIDKLPLRSAFSPDGTSVFALSHARRWRSWRYDRSQPSGFSFNVHQSAPFSALSVWDQKTGKKKACLHLHDCFLYTTRARFSGTSGSEEDPIRFAFSPDGRSVFVGCRGLRQIDLATNKITRVFHRP